MTATINREAEGSVLGMILLEGSLISDVIIQPEHFYAAGHRNIFQAMKACADEGSIIDIVTVTTKLGAAIQQVGGTTYLLELAQSVASTASLKHHEQLILEAYQSRMAQKAALHFVDNPTVEGLDKLMKDLKTYSEMGADKEGLSTYDQLLAITEEMCFPVEEQAGFATSFHDVDAMTGGLQRGELTIVAARPSVGKTAFALNLAANHAENDGSSLLFSLEMGIKPLLQRMISAKAAINSQKWRNMVFSLTDYEQAFQAVGSISDWKLALYDTLRTIPEIRAALRKKMREHPGERHVAIIDYLQLLTPVGKHERRDLEIGEITRELKLLAVELDIPIVLLSQLSRGVEARQDKRPLMSDLRESGNIEQDADVITFLYRDDYYDRNKKEQSRMELIVSKQRNGPTGTIELLFDKTCGRFSDLQEGEAFDENANFSIAKETV